MGCGCKTSRNGRAATLSGFAPRGTRTPARWTLDGLGELYHSQLDVSNLIDQINAQLSQSFVPTWNGCSDQATDATGQALSSDITTWFTSWQAYAGQTRGIDPIVPAGDDWNTCTQYQTELASLVARVNAYCGADVQQVTPPAPGPNWQSWAQVAAVIAIGGIAVIALGEVAVILFETQGARRAMGGG